MKWITREKVKVDRVACPWLIQKFVDPNAEFLFVPADQVMEIAAREGATPYDVKGVELGHHGKECSFEAILRKYTLTTNPALVLLGKIVNGADTDNTLWQQPEGAGLEAVAEGFRHLGFKDDHQQNAAEWIVYDALYAYCQESVRQGKLNGMFKPADILFLCPHNAAKSVIAAAYFNQRAPQAGLLLTADSAGTEPSEVVAPGVVALLGSEGLDVSHHQPRRVNPLELAATARIVAMGYTPAELTAFPERTLHWDDVPAVSEQPARARDTIRRHVDQLIADLQEKLV